MRVAIYARVSTERQSREQTIESQLSLLQQWVQAQHHTLCPQHIYTDAGYSGARLDRPGLDALRDAAAARAFDLVAVLCPDRLARKYAYQVVLLEELQRSGCEVVFLQHPLSDDPNDQLLLQIQGAIAEYERAVLGERFRRGKLQKARAGHWIGGKAPYGYRYVPKQEGVPGYLVVDEVEAEFVRILYQWLIDEQLTIRQILKRLNEGPWHTRAGKAVWSPSVVHHILSDPIYTGTAYLNRYRFVPPKKPRKPARPHTRENSCRQPRPKEEWIAVAVPAILDQKMYDLAQAQLERNAARSFRNNTKHSYLLRCLLTCKSCGLAMFGTTYKATARQPERRYYKCHGKDPLLAAREERCCQALAKAEELETAVWDHVSQLLRDPEQLLTTFAALATEATEGDARTRAERQQVERQLERLARQEQRLIDAYQADVISLEELRQRRQLLAEQRQAVVVQQEQRTRLRIQAVQAAQVFQDVHTFCEGIARRLQTATFEEKQTILQLLIERIIVGEDTLEIRHVIPLRSPSPEPGDSGSPVVRLRTDGVKLAALPGNPTKDRAACFFQTGMCVANY
jgi:site-specific DNA recombinase